MVNKKEAYLCLSAMLRAREPKLLSLEKAKRMVDASSFEEAAKSLAELGYADMSDMQAVQINNVLSEHVSEIFDEIDRLSPDSITDIFRIKYDYHNTKVIIKSEAQGIKADNLLSNLGRIKPDQLKGYYYNEQYKFMPGKLGEAMAEAKAVLARSANPQMMDFYLDGMCFEEIRLLAAELDNAFVMGYYRILTDSANLKSIVRALRMEKSAAFMNDAVLDGGMAEKSEIISNYGNDDVFKLFSKSNLSGAPEKALTASKGGSLTEFELECDNAVNAYLRKAKYANYGCEPVIAYLAAVEGEVTVVRMILTGRLAGVKGDILKERLRDMYA